MAGAHRKQVFIASSALFLLGPTLPFVIGPVERLMGTVRRGTCRHEEMSRDPVVEVIIPAYLERTTVGPTVVDLEDALMRAGLKHVVHVVASDAATAAAAAQAGRVTLTSRNGKPAAINLAVGGSSADIIVLSDANCRISPVEWPLIMLKELACCGLLSGDKTEKASTESLFWRFESRVKRRSSGRDGTLAVVGEFLAFRRADFRPVPVTTMTDDLWLALDFHARGLTVQTSGVITTSEEPARRAEQWERRVRIAVGVLSEALPRLGELARDPVGRHYLSHKLYRSTIGAAAFWTAAASLAAYRPRVTLPAVGLPLAACVVLYRGLIEVRTPVDPVVAIVGMQAVPAAAAGKILQQRLRGHDRRSLGWRKIPR